MSIVVILRLLFATLLIGELQTVTVSSQSIHLPSQTVFIDVPGLAVLGENGTFRDIITPLNPTNQTPPFFQVWDSAFLDILGPNPSIRVTSERDDFQFAFEGPIWSPATNEVFFSSFPTTSSGMRRNQVSKIDLDDVKGQGTQNITSKKIPITPDIPSIGGGTPYKDKLLFTTGGSGNVPPGLVVVAPRSPYNATIILDNLHGRQFNSLNDVKVHPKSGIIFFTDNDVGFLEGARPPPTLPNQVYRFDPKTSQLRLAADGFNRSNGIAFSPDGTIVYIGDSGATTPGKEIPMAPATIYAFDVDETTQAFTNRRVLAYIDTDSPDGIQVDSNGNTYAASGDGIQIYSPSGLLLGKIFTGSDIANHIFAGKGKMVVLARTKIYLVEFAAAPSLVELQ